MLHCPLGILLRSITTNPDQREGLNEEGELCSNPTGRRVTPGDAAQPRVAAGCVAGAGRQAMAAAGMCAQCNKVVDCGAVVSAAWGAACGKGVG